MTPKINSELRRIRERERMLNQSTSTGVLTSQTTIGTIRSAIATPTRTFSRRSNDKPVWL